MSNSHVLADRSLSALLDEIAARSPAPGGGSSAAWACALGAGLVAMAARFTVDRPAFEEMREEMIELQERADRLRATALELAEQELTSYAPVLEALRLAPDEPTREPRVRAALSQAAEVPLETVRLGATVAELAVDVASRGNPFLRGDALAGALLAEAGCSAAACLVRINLDGAADDDPRLLELDALLGRAGAARRKALQ